MHPRVGLQSIEGRDRTAQRWAIHFALLAIMSGSLLDTAFGQTTPAPTLPSWASDAVASARCLAGEGCGRSAASACIAEQTIKTAPLALQARALALSRSKRAKDCRAAMNAVAGIPGERERLREIYQSTPEALLSDRSTKEMRNYYAACLSPELALDQGPVTPAQTRFLRDHIGLIVRRNNPNWQGPQPICEAARLGRFIVTAQRCVPAEARTSARPGDYIEDIGFRFFDSPTIYGLTLRHLGTENGAREEQPRDYAILEILRTPSLNEDVEGLLGTVQLFDDFVTVTAEITAVLGSGRGSSAVKDFNSITFIHKNTLCHPAYIAPNGLFLHSCIIGSALSLGAPLFQLRNGRLVFVGIHSGDTETLPDPSLAACAPGLSKYGIAIPPTILREALSN